MLAAVFFTDYAFYYGVNLSFSGIFIEHSG